MPRSIFDILAWQPHEVPRVRALLGMRKFWSTQLYGRLRDEYEAAVADGNGPESEDAAFELVENLPTTPRWAWLDRHIQDRLWQEVGEMVDARADAFAESLAPRPDDLGTLTLDPDQTYPDYYSEIDFHRQDGGIWRDDRGAAIYAMGARVIHVGKNDDFGLHKAFARDIPLAAPETVLDLACGFGKTTFSLKQRYPDAAVEGIDLSAPCLRLGRRMATEMDLAIDWRQGDIEHLPYEAGSFDLATTTMTLHELPLDAIRQSLAEACRVLKPGGLFVALENPLIGEPLRDVLTHYHSQIIVEPFHYEFRRSDMATLLTEAGFETVEVKRWYPFGPATRGAETDPKSWVTPWSWIEARKCSVN